MSVENKQYAITSNSIFTQKVLLEMPFIATSCCILKASLCRARSCCLLNPICPFLLRRPKEMDVIRALIHPWALGLAYILVRLEKGAAARSLSRKNYRAFLRNDCVSLRLYCISLRLMIYVLFLLSRLFLSQFSGVFKDLLKR